MPGTSLKAMPTTPSAARITRPLTPPPASGRSISISLPGTRSPEWCRATPLADRSFMMTRTAVLPATRRIARISRPSRRSERRRSAASFWTMWRNSCTWPRSRSASLLIVPVPSSTLRLASFASAATWTTFSIERAACEVEAATCWMLEAISRTVILCSSTAAEMAPDTSPILPMMPVISFMTTMVSPVAVRTLSIWALISAVALAVCAASALTSPATTAKPLPASPARAASIVAFSARRFVCPAMFSIRRTTSPIRPVDSVRPRMVIWLASARCTACPVTSAATVTWRAISPTLAVNSSTAAETPTRSTDDLAAPPAVSDAWFCTAVADSTMTSADWRMFCDAVRSVSMTWETEIPNAWVCLSMKS